jgi:hypothetical protein
LRQPTGYKRKIVFDNQSKIVVLRTLLSIILLNISGLTRAVEPSKFDWVGTARAFLIGAYQPPFAPKLEFDAEAVAETMADMHVNTIRMTTMGKYATIQAVRFPTHPDQGDRDLLAEMIAACKPRKIRVVPYISTGHKLAWSTVTKHYPEYAHRSSPNGGPIRDHMFVGEDHGTVCWMTPYRQAYMDLVKHVVCDYEIDGMYFDKWVPFYFWPEPQLCYCDGCRKGFRRATGLEIPWRANHKGYSKHELTVIDKYHRWYKAEYIKIIQEVQHLVKSNKDIPLIYNINNPERIANEDPCIILAMDAFLYERGNTMLERAEGVSLARAEGLDIWPYVGVYNNWPRVCYYGVNYQQQIFTNAMFGGGSIIAQPTGYLYHEDNRKYVRYAFSILEKNQKDFSGLENYPYVAVAYAFSNPPGHTQSSHWWKTDSRTATLGAFAACIYRHLQTSSIHEKILDRPNELSRYKVIYLADNTNLSEQRIENIKQFVKQGGGLITSYATSLYNRKGEHLESFGLETLIRVKPRDQDEALKEMVRYYSVMTGGPDDLYLLTRSDSNRILGDCWKGRLVPLWFYEPVEVLQGATVLMDIVAGDGNRRLFPGVVFSKYGKGRVIYLSSSIESLFLQDNQSILGDLIKRLVKIVAPEPPPYSMEAPSSLISNLTVKEDHWVLHMMNWTGNKFERNRLSEYYLAPVEDVQVCLRIPDGKTIEKISLLVDGKFNAKNRGHFLKLSFPRIEAYQAVSIELKKKYK